ncbi:ABC transporter ATP-binding protein [Paenibacillus nasutitermitis]|uniref:Multidrug ABC transporter ATP-binding protein n=1 Tax=Paenibacillus nasutitermitis TaxID=1652958 RepID=A0A917E423_9BACL|nr:ABC transporter ATP-binding protein [Paenibacillus nasutitermitis]GGE02769.1 multidrug ABC transporter ATP-binding protein [Paenibacillus nasutitermitis]
MPNNRNVNWRWLWQFVKPMKKIHAFMLFLMLCQCVITLAVTGVQKFIIDDVILGQNYDKLPLYIGLFIVVFLLFLVLYYAVAHYIYFLRMETQHLVAAKFMSAVLKLSQKDLHEERTAAFVHYMREDADNVAQVLTNRLPRGIQHLFYVVTILSIFSQMGFGIVIASIGLILIYLVLGKYTAPVVRKAAREISEERSKLGILIEEGITSTREVLSYGRQQWEKQRYHTQFQALYKKVEQEGKKANLQILLTEPMKWGIHVALLGFGGYSVIQGRISLGTFLVTYQFIAQLINSFQNLFNFSMDISRGLSSAERLQKVIAKVKSSEGTYMQQGPVSEIVFKKVDFSYELDRQVPVLDNLSFTIPMGKKIAFVGTSGGGKSTIAAMLIRCISPNGGEILADDVPLLEWQQEHWMKRIAFVQQEPYLLPASVRDNITFGLPSADIAIRNACEQAQIHAFIQEMSDGYDSIIGERGITLSGGQRQRLALARALLRDPEILILDEATSALDLETERQVMKRLDSIRAGKTTLIIAHRLSTILNADLIIVLDKGKVAGMGDYAQLLNSCEPFSRLVSMDREKQYSA